MKKDVNLIYKFLKKKLKKIKKLESYDFCKYLIENILFKNLNFLISM